MSRTPQTNGLRERLDADRVSLGVLDSTYDSSLIELYGRLGVDFVWIDFEHGGPSPWNAERLEDLLRAAEAGGTELLVRLPETNPALIRKALDAGVRNVFLPRVDTAAEVREALRAARFEYGDEPGERGLANPRARQWGLAEDYVATEDREVVVGATIETLEGVANIDEIVDVEGLGFVFLGPLDLSVAVGQPGNVEHADVQEAVELARETALDAGVPVGGLGFGPEDVNEKIDQGYQLLNVGSTTGAVRASVGNWLKDIER